jgi:cyclic nucleotide-binding protein
MQIGSLHIGIAEFFAAVGAVFYVATIAMQTMVPLRIAGIVSTIFFILYGYYAKSYPTMFMYLFLLPLNIVRLRQMLMLVKKVKVSSSGDLTMNWLKPFMTRRQYFKGDILFQKGDVADEMYYTVTGKFLLTELGIEVAPGQLVGEMGLLSPENQRTATLECVGDGDVLTISYERLRELYFQNPEFGFYFLKLTSGRLLQNISRLEDRLAEKTLPLRAAPAHS